jgi:predicted phosphate transport protein (TIGR00153 family)
MVRIIPREAKFFEMFAEQASNLTQGARLLMEILEDYTNVEVRVKQLKEIETRADEVTHNILTKLNQSFITPFDREDIHRLASSLDDVLDFVNAAGERLVMYKIGTPPSPAGELAGIVVKQCEALEKAVALLEKNDGMIDYLVEINRLENQADEVARRAIGRLFEHEKDPISLIKVKELYEVLEMATDKAEDAANVLETVVLKST